VIRWHPFFGLAGGSLAALAVLVYLLYLESLPKGGSGPAARSLRVYCAAALKPVMQGVAADYERETGVRVEFDFGDSGAMLANATLRPDGDLFLPADDSYVRLAEQKGLVAEVVPLCRMRPVILTRPGNPLGIAKFEDLLKSGVRLGLANPDRAAIGKVVRDHLRAQGKWDAFAARVGVQHANVTESANAVSLGSRDATVVWDAVAVNYPQLAVVHVPELDGATGRVELAVLKTAPDPAAARRFARYAAASDRGLSHFKRAGFAGVESGAPWAEAGGAP
jgi:molybdate transport system substrate-binding protein